MAVDVGLGVVNAYTGSGDRRGRLERLAVRNDCQTSRLSFGTFKPQASDCLIRVRRSLSSILPCLSFPSPLVPSRPLVVSNEKYRYRRQRTHRRRPPWFGCSPLQVQPKQVAVGSARSTWTMDALGVLGAMGAAGLAVCARRPRTWAGYGAGVAQDKGSWSGGVVSAVALVAAAGLAAPVLQRACTPRPSHKSLMKSSATA